VPVVALWRVPRPDAARVDKRRAGSLNGAVNGIHDLGGMHGFGRVVVEPNEPVFHERWEGRMFAVAALLTARGLANADAFRHAIERLPPAVYLTAGYYGRWLAAVERLLVERGILAPGELDARARGEHAAGGDGRLPERSGALPGARREVARAPRFAAGQTVVARNLHPAGHTRLPRYVRGRRGIVARVHPAWVFPDSNAHGLGENPQHAYAVRFAARELWGEDADAHAAIHVDLFEAYLEPAP
jgi:nitrile hydratase subunit beta